MSEKPKDLHGALELVLQRLNQKGNTELGEQLVQALGMKEKVEAVVQKPANAIDDLPESLEEKIDRLYSLCLKPNSGLYFVSMGPTGLDQRYGENADMCGRRNIVLDKSTHGFRELDCGATLDGIFNPENANLSLVDALSGGFTESPYYWKGDKNSKHHKAGIKFNEGMLIVTGSIGKPKSHIFHCGYQNDNGGVERAFFGYGFPIPDKRWKGDQRGSYMIFGIMVDSYEGGDDTEVNGLLYSSFMPYFMNTPDGKAYKLLMGVLKRINPELADYIETLPKP